jgi:hypothetical protein
VVPAAQQQPGFRRIELLTDRLTGKGVTVSRTSDTKSG